MCQDDELTLAIELIKRETARLHELDAERRTQRHRLDVAIAKGRAAGLSQKKIKDYTGFSRTTISKARAQASEDDEA